MESSSSSTRSYKIDSPYIRENSSDLSDAKPRIDRARRTLESRDVAYAKQVSAERKMIAGHLP